MFPLSMISLSSLILWPRKFTSNSVKKHLLFFDIELVLLKHFKHVLKMLNMRLDYIATNDNIV